MDEGRRRIMQGAGIALLGSGFCARFDRVAAAQKASTLTAAVDGQASGKSESLLLGPQPDEEGPPRPATVDRLSLDWNKRTVARFKKLLAEREVEAFLVRDPLNIIYLTGYWHSTTERPQAVYMNGNDAEKVLVLYHTVYQYSRAVASVRSKVFSLPAALQT